MGCLWNSIFLLPSNLQFPSSLFPSWFQRHRRIVPGLTAHLEFGGPRSGEGSSGRMVKGLAGEWRWLFSFNWLELSSAMEMGALRGPTPRPTSCLAAWEGASGTRGQASKQGAGSTKVGLLGHRWL